MGEKLKRSWKEGGVTLGKRKGSLSSRVHEVSQSDKSILTKRIREEFRDQCHGDLVPPYPRYYITSESLPQGM